MPCFYYIHKLISSGNYKVRISAVLIFRYQTKYILCLYACQDNKIIDYSEVFGKIYRTLGTLFESEVYSLSYGTYPERYTDSI